MKQIFLISALVIAAFGDRLDNRYLPPGPNNDNNQYQPPPISPGFQKSNSFPNQPFTSASQSQQQFAAPNRQYLTPKTQDFSSPSKPFSSNKAPEQSGQSSNQFGQFSQPKQFNSGNNGFSAPNRQYLTPEKQGFEQSGQSSNQFGQFSQPKQSNNGFSHNNGAPAQFKQSNQFGAPSGHFGTPSGKFGAPSGQLGSSSNQFGSPSTQYGSPSNQFGSSAGHFGSPSGKFGSPSGHSSQFAQPNQYSTQQSSQGPQIGLVRSEFNPDGGDGHYSYLYETENGINAQEEGFIKESGKFAQGGYSYTSPEGEQISIEYTADENGFVPKGSHVPQIPEAILKSIELNKAAEARGEYNEGSYREDYSDSGYQGNGYAKQGQQNNGYQYSAQPQSQAQARPTLSKSLDQGTFASQPNKQITPFPAPGKSFSSPAQDQSTFASQPNKQVAPFGGHQNPSSNQGNFARSGFGEQNQGYQYPSPNGNAGFNGKYEQQTAPSGVQNQYNVPQFGTVQDKQGGYKY